MSEEGEEDTREETAVQQGVGGEDEGAVKMQEFLGGREGGGEVERRGKRGWERGREGDRKRERREEERQ